MPGRSGTYYGGIFNFTRTNGDAPVLLPGANSPDNYFIGMCLEFNESISYGATHTWTLTSLDQAPDDAANNLPSGMGTTKADNMRRLLGHVLPNFELAPSLTNQTAIALQIALWEIVHETEEASYVLATGNARFTGSSVAGALALAQGWLDNLNGGNQANWTFAQNVYAITKDGVQDYLVQTVVPIPAAAWLLGSGLIGLIGIGRRRKALSA